MRAGSIVLVTNNFPPVLGGSASVYANLARCANGRIIVLAPHTDYRDGLPIIGWREHDRGAGYPIIRLPLLRTEMGDHVRSGVDRFAAIALDAAIRLRVVGALLKTIVFQKVRTVCVGELLTGGWIVSVMRLVPGVKVVTYVHGEEITTSDSYDVGHRRARRALQHSDRIVTVSNFTYRAVQALIGSVSGNRLCLIHNGVDTDKFRPKEKSADLLQLYGLQDCFVFVSISRLIEKKGTDNAIRAFAQVVAKYANCRLLVVGAGPYRDRLEEIVAELGLRGLVIFTGAVAQAELVEHYQLGDVFVMPNRRLPDGDTEGFGVVFLEANGCGLPAIAGRDGGSIEAVQNGVNGLVVDGNDVDQIAHAMMLLREDQASYSAMRSRCLTIAAESDWRFKTEQFLEVCLAD
jgi:phosphatidylinositol alpha-1,6-mannosyltransferase